ncbi:DUF302 domain-containing protein [Arenibacter sp. F20364]|uniref:DUF302 domain-containing protein n=1 Tax=Arenibacter sp. F20364 TaxID=2926415 RepID=UPI001FF2B944|nr:DUF302 domain-containing protein [Arenibacter sp. F20364]MCK0192606.1 DUF302 domain-containing protein [Arenibacter sp. F20364]
MKSSVIQRKVNNNFLDTYKSVKRSIERNGFLLLHEIDTQKIVSEHGVVIPKLIQLLFFDPKYVSQIMKKDPLAFNDIPLKIVVRDLEDGTTEVSFQNPIGNLIDYDVESEMLIELELRLDEIFYL